ncbi:c-type cytochrome [Chromobacterium sp. IIBBL 290-4]|uniref:c-type cytochrome n=1 Tax=Chromobacterium sp. IIBBL 290-4 TaxID=2953890 RepID=UPI0020B821A2|nr:c-type cytochrome [Chromobacterium sp. IIBBL 290-4]UTH76646.1 c-type cytochrome [Chromobacterium sp. IIBBL 290-4]
MKTLWMIGLFGALLLTSAAQADRDPETLARSWCANCHGADGNSVSPLFPRLAGQQAAYLQQQLKVFREQSRSDQAAHDYMWGVAGGLNDAEIAGVAAYFSTQKAKPNPAAPGEAAKLAAGKAIFLQGKGDSVPACFACHGAQAEGTEQAPRLAGQHAAYLLKQLHVFSTSQRPAAVAMQAIVHDLSEDDLNSLAAYLQSL